MIKLQGEGYYTLYMHNDALLASVGENVPQGQIIAKMGNSGSGRGIYMAVHCHFGLYPEPLIINGFGGAVDSLPYFTAMRYVILNGEQFLLDDNLKIAFNIGDEIELAKLQLHGLSGNPETISSLDNYLIYPMVERPRLKDLFGL
jgi:murein DD-endopeptidase MepM/ murein hydrolase activator NlpD